MHKVHFDKWNVLLHWERIRKILLSDGDAAQSKTIDPITIEVNPFDFCDHSCSWCFTRDYRSNAHFSNQELNDVLESVLSMDIRSLHFSGGGEPTLNKSLFPNADQYDRKNCYTHRLAQKGVSLGLITHGAHLNKLIKTGQAYDFSWIRVSLDASNPDSYRSRHGDKHTFDRVIENLRTLAGSRKSANSPSIGVSYIFEAADDIIQAEIVDFVNLASQLNLDFVQVKPELRLAENEADAFLDQLETRFLNEEREACPLIILHRPARVFAPTERCWYGAMGTVVGATGDCYACCFKYGRVDYQYADIGKHASFAKAWRSDERIEKLLAIDPKNCGDCRHSFANELLQELSKLPKEHLSALDEAMKIALQGRAPKIPGCLNKYREGIEHTSHLISTGLQHPILNFPVYRPGAVI